MNETVLKFNGKAHSEFSKFKTHLEQLGFTSITSSAEKLELEKIERSDLKGQPNKSYKAVFQKDVLIFSYSVGTDKRKRDFEAMAMLMNLINVSEGFFEISASELAAPLSETLKQARAMLDLESYATVNQVSELQEKFYSLEKKYKDLVLSSEQNTRILLECEKKRNEYAERIKQLEAMSDESLAQEIFKWLKTHSGEISTAQFAKSYSIPVARVEEGLEVLLKKGYIRKK